MSALDPPRGALRAVVQACALAHRTLGLTLPCLAVQPDGPGRPGYAVVRAPGRATHVIVVPLEPIDGIEDPRLLAPEAGEYWRAALRARRFVVEAAGGAVDPSRVALAINAARTRSQDQLHIHAECVRPDVAAAVFGQRSQLPEGWSRSRGPVAGTRPFLLPLDAREIEADNVFAILAGLPGGAGTADGTTALLLPVPGAGGRFVLVAERGGVRSVERYFQHDCRPRGA